MSIRNRLLAAAAVSALTVATAVPAMALENEFHGLFRVKGIIDNFNNSGGGDLVPATSDNSGTRSFVEQRARLQYIAKASDDLKLVTHFEIDSRWGDSSYNSNDTLRNAGAGIGADQVNLETKNVYLDFNVPATPVNVKLGLQGYTDPYKGIIFNNDAAGVSATAKVGSAAFGITYFRFDDAVTNTPNTVQNLNGVGGIGFISNNGTTTATAAPTNGTPGSLTRDFLTVSGSYSINKDIKVGLDYFLLYNDILKQSADRTNIHMVGANAAATFGPLSVDGFALYQFGKLTNTAVAGNSQIVSAFAANVGSKVKVGPGTLRSNVLYISGDNDPSNGANDRNDFQTIMERGATTSGHTFFPGEMQIMLRNKTNINSDRALVFDLNNKSQGLIGGFVGYDLAINKLYVNSNVGFAAVAKDRGPALGGFNNANGHNSYLGTELNTEVGYKLYDNMTASVQAAYMVLGGYFTNAAGSHPENPYSTKLMFNYTF